MLIHTAGSPYQFYVDAVDSGVVAAYGPGLSYGVAGEPCSFTIDTKNAGAGMSSDFCISITNVSSLL